MSLPVGRRYRLTVRSEVAMYGGSFCCCDGAEVTLRPGTVGAGGSSAVRQRDSREGLSSWLNSEKIVGLRDGQALR